MKRLFSQLALITILVALGGCYYDPGYSYTRGNGYGGDAYYGTVVTPTYVVPSYYGGYGYGAYGCCYAPGVSIGISNGYYPYRGPSYGYYGGAVYRGRGPYQGGHYDHGNDHYDHYRQDGHGRPRGYAPSGSAGRPSSSYQRPPAGTPSHAHAPQESPRSHSYSGAGRKPPPRTREDR